MCLQEISMDTAIPDFVVHELAKASHNDMPCSRCTVKRLDLTTLFVFERVYDCRTNRIRVKHQNEQYLRF